MIFLYYTYPNQIDLLSPYFKNAYIAEMSSNIMGEKDLSLDFLLSFWPDLLHPYEYLRTTKSGVSKVKQLSVELRVESSAQKILKP